MTTNTISIIAKKIIVIEFIRQNYSKIGDEIKEQLLRLNTLQLIDPNECMMQWQKFVQHTQLINYCTVYFETVILHS